MVFSQAIRTRLKENSLRTFKLFCQVCLGAGAYTLYDQRVGCFRRIYGMSMTPTLNGRYMKLGTYEDSPGFNSFEDVIYFSRDTQNLKRGDIVLCNRPKKENASLVKRIVAVEGDSIRPVGPGGKVLDPVKLSAGQVWVESDAGPGYLDSAVFGPLPVEAVTGVAIFCIGFYDASPPRLLESAIPASVGSRLEIASELP